MKKALTLLTFKNLYLVFFSITYFSLFPPYFYTSVGIDASWQESLVLALNNHFEFGTDFIFNYGPLGFLNTLVIPENFSPWGMFVFHLFLLSNYLFIIAAIFQKFPNHKFIFSIFYFFLIFPYGFFADTTFTLFFFMLFWLLSYQNHTNRLNTFYLIANFVILFFIKLNISFIAFFLMVIFLIILSVQQPKKLKYNLITIAITIFSTLILAKILNFNILNSYEASFKIIDAYQDSMTVLMSSTKEIFFFLILTFFATVAILFLFFKNIKTFKLNFWVYAFFGMTFFLAYKQGFTALANINIAGFFSLLPPLTILLLLFLQKTPKTQLFLLVAFIFFIKTLAVVGIGLKAKQGNGMEYIRSWFPAKLSNKIKDPNTYLSIIKENNPLIYIKTAAEYDYQNNFRNPEINKERILPAKILKQIGKHTVDILPWEVSYIFYNKLNYKPRPIIQSYQANSDWLVQKNGERYYSSPRPDFVLANLKEFREQNPFWTDKICYQSLTENYVLRDSAFLEKDTLLLFQTKINLSKKFPYPTGIFQKYPLSKTLKIPKSQTSVYLYANVAYSFWGKIRRFFFQPYYLRCELKLDNGQKLKFRIPPPILKGGILINKKITTNKDFINYVNFKGLQNQNIVSIRFYSDENIGFVDEFTYAFAKE